MKKCQICNKQFESNSKNQKNCLEHCRIKYGTYKVINSILNRKCTKCNIYKEISNFYKKQKGRCSSWCIECFNKGTYQYQSDRATARKLLLVKRLGGKCSICNYNKNLAVLCFHHINDKTKSFELDARSLGNMSQKNINEEVKKCILLCHNCHGEIHYPHFNNLV